MRLFLLGSVALLVVLAASLTLYAEVSSQREVHFSDTEPGFTEPLSSLPPILEPMLDGRVRWSAYWEDMTADELRVYGTLPPREGPLRVGIQAGHWRLDEVPLELAGLRASSGASGGGVSEQKTVLAIAQETKAMLEERGIVVDLLPATVPVDYVADAFVSIHADGSASAASSGFKIAGPRRDFSGTSGALVSALYQEYGTETGLRQDANITRRMNGYYAFNWRRYDHALHPLVPAAIVETGFMTSASDRALIVARPEVPARGIADGILAFFGML
ncbi:MAG: N-acetylmuramoyl-L-alanine amidase [Patescibacteria group bacterium]